MSRSALPVRTFTFSERWAKIANSNGRLGLALRRWTSAKGRRRDDDKIIDDWIGLEALFSPANNQEIRHRVALRIAALIGTSGVERQDLYKAMCHSYDWRSALVHGAGSKRHRELSKKKDLPTTEAETHDCLRRILLYLLRRIEPFDPEMLDEALLTGVFAADVPWRA